MTALRRRTLLRGIVATGAAGLAGCSSDDPTSIDGDSGSPPSRGGADPFRDWLLPERTIEQGNGLLFEYDNYALAADRGLEWLLEDRDDMAEFFGVDPTSVHGRLLVGAQDGSPNQIFPGSFDPDEIVAYANDERDEPVTDEYSGYTIVDDRYAVGEDAVVGAPYRDYIDANTDETDRLEDHDPDAELLLNGMPEGLVLNAILDPNTDDVTFIGTSQTGFDEMTPTENVSVVVFTDADVVTEERVDRMLEDYFGGVEDVTDVTAGGQVVTVEYVPSVPG